MSKGADPVLDAAAEFIRQDKAQTFDLLPEVGPSMFDDVGESPSFTASTDPRPRRNGEIQTLEDLYAAYPDIGRGEWKLRITRTFPKAHQGVATAGFLGEIFEKISLVEFQNRYGGGTYVVGVMKPTSQFDATLADYKQVKEVRFRISGDPNVERPATAEDKRGNGMTQMPVQSEKVEIARLQMDEREKQRLYEEKRRAEERLDHERQRQQPVEKHVYDATRMIVADAREMGQQQLNFWLSECDRLRGELNLSYNENKNIRAQLLEAQNKANTTDRVIESKVINEQRVNYEQRIAELKDQLTSQLKDQRDRYEEERRRMQDEHSRKVEQLSSDHRTQIADITRRHDEAYRSFESAQALERERVRESAKDRVDQVERQKASEMAHLRETYESRLEDLRRSTEREIQSVRDATQREIESIRQTERVTAAMAKESAEQRKDALEAEKNRIREELKELRRERDELRTKLNKEPVQYIAEVKQVATDILGMVDAGDVEQPTGEQSTVSQIFGLAKQAFDSAPAVMEKIMQARQQNQSAAVQVQAQQIQMQQLAQQQAMQQAMAAQQQQRALPQGRYAGPGQPQAQQRAYTPPPFGGSGAAPVSSTPPPFGPIPSVVASPIQPGSSTDVVAAGSTMPFDQPGGSSESQAAVAATAPVDVAQVVATQSAGPVATQAQASMQAQAIPNAAVVEFFKQLEGAIVNRVIAPETFADALIEQATLPQVAMFLNQYTPNDVIETARQLSTESAIDTRHGHGYVEAVWKRAAERVGFARKVE